MRVVYGCTESRRLILTTAKSAGYQAQGAQAPPYLPLQPLENHVATR